MACYLHTGSINAARELMNRGLVQVQMDCQRMYLSYKLILLEGKDASGMNIGPWALLTQSDYF